MNPPDPSSTPSLRRIGAYEVRRVLGSGGMGTVYEALQTNPRRLVALKLIRSSASSPQALRRFEYEAEILARLKHPGIAQIYEASTYERGGETTPYFAMEYVEDACTILTYAVKHRLDVRARLRLFLQVCDAVHHGHQNGVIHRDLKPENLLVNGTGQVKVIDFGVARMTDGPADGSAGLTQAGQVIGTFQYMAPEQIDRPLEIDIRADVYSLGVLLYELLANQRPYDITQVEIVEALRMIRETAPRKITTITRTVSRELELITLMALEKERERRYPSARALREDIESFLKGGSIVARPPSTLYQLRVFARRNKAVVVGAILVLSALLAGFVVSTREYLRAEQARALAESARSEAQLQAANAEASAAEARAQQQEADRQRAEALRQQEEAHRQARIATEINRFLCDDVLAAANPLREPDPTVTVRAVLREVGEQVDRRFAAEPVVAAALHATVGSSYVGLGLLAEAERHFSRSETLLEQYYPGKSPLRRQLRFYQAILEIRRGEYAAGIASLWETHDYHVQQHSTAEPDSIEAALSLVSVLVETGQLDTARELIDETLPLARELGDEHFRLQALLLALDAVQRMETDDLDVAIRQQIDLVQLLEEKHWDRSLLWYTARTNLGYTYVRAGRFGLAEQLFLENIEWMSRDFGEDHVDVMSNLNNLALVYKNQGRMEEAAELHRRDLAISEKKLGRHHPLTLITLSNLGRLYHRMSRTEEAEELLAEAAEELLAQTPDVRITGITFHVWGECQLELGWFEEARDNLLTAHELLLDQLEADDAEMAALRGSLARVYAELGDAAGAARWSKR